MCRFGLITFIVGIFILAISINQHKGVEGKSLSVPNDKLAPRRYHKTGQVGE